MQFFKHFVWKGFPRILSSILSSPSTVLAPKTTTSKSITVVGSKLPESQLQFLQRLQSCFLDDFFSSWSDEDEHDGFNVFGKLESHGSSYVHEQMHSGFTEFNASNRVKRYEEEV